MSSSIKLDKSQREIVTAPSSLSAVVTAPPGHGKTLVMARRIGYLISSGALVAPRRLLGLTFTNAAAAEMKYRIASEVPSSQLGRIDLNTIHSFCYFVLKSYGHYIGLSHDFNILGDRELQSLLEKSNILKRIAEENGHVFKDLIANYKNWLIDSMLKQHDVSNIYYYHQDFQQLNISYQQYLLEKKSMDFTHLLMFTFRLFSEHPYILDLYRAAYDFVLIDEFQDTNPLQFEILSLLIEGNEQSKLEKQIPVMFFGDKYQAIYEFLGATSKNIDIAQERFNCEKTFELKLNYRARHSKKVLELSASLRDDIGNIPTKNFTELNVHSNLNEEAKFINNIISNLHNRNILLHNICIIAPNQYRLLQVVKQLSDEKYVFIPDFKAKNIETKFLDLFHKLRQMQIGEKSLSNVVSEYIKSRNLNSGFIEVLKLIKILARNYDKQFSDLNLSERGMNFANHLLLEINWGHLIQQHIKNRVFISSIHGVKGLEFEYVIICGLEDGVIPFRNVCSQCASGINRNKVLEDVRAAERLLYVGVTRSGKDLSLHCVKRDYKNESRSISCTLEKAIDYLDTKGVSLNDSLCGYDHWK